MLGVVLGVCDGDELWDALCDAVLLQVDNCVPVWLWLCVALGVCDSVCETLGVWLGVAVALGIAV